MVKGDLVAAYGYLSPASRSSLTVNDFVLRAGRGVKFWRSIEDVGAKCEAEVCQVKAVLAYDLSDSVKGLKREINETWIKDEGQWWAVANQR